LRTCSRASAAGRFDVFRFDGRDVADEVRGLADLVFRSVVLRAAVAMAIAPEALCVIIRALVRTLDHPRVTHLDVTREQCERAVCVMNRIAAA